MSSAPLPTTLTLLTSLPTHETGSKVRFLGCVAAYHLSTGTLLLQHAYPSSPSQASHTIALVDVNLLLEGLKRGDTVVGAWVNVVGYVEGLDGEEGSRRAKEKGGSVGKEDVGVEQVDGGVVRVRVKAVMLWSAGGVKIGDYERAVEGRMRAERGC